MYQLRRFHGARFERVNGIIDSLGGHVTQHVNLIGSATLPFPEVCQMQGLPGTACRAEGHLGARLFPGTDPIDRAEAIIDEECRRLFKLSSDYAVSGQPHSATQANHAVFRAVLGDEPSAVCYLSPGDGGHISHRLGMPPHTRLHGFPLIEDGIDYDALEDRVREHSPRLLVAGGTSYTRAIDYPRLRLIADRVGAHLHADLAHTAPYVIAGLHPDVLPFADSVTLDTSKNLRGPRGGVLIYGGQTGSDIRRSIFPVLQSSPSQSALMAKALCLTMWTVDEVSALACRMVSLAKEIEAPISEVTGPAVFGGTDTHLLLFDLRSLDLDGRTAEGALEKHRILANRNQIPGDEQPHWVTSGIRLGTTVPAILEYSKEDTRELGRAIAGLLAHGLNPSATVDRLLGEYHEGLVNIASGST